MSSSILSFFQAIVFIFVSHTTFASKPRLVIGGLAGINGGSEGWSSAGVLPAVEMALEGVNNRSDILNNYYLDIEWKDSKCASGFAIKGMVEHITESPHKIAFLGPGCSIAAAPVAETLPFWNVTEISFSLTSPALSDKNIYSTLYRINPSETIHDPALVALIDLFKWKRLFIIKHELRIFNVMSETIRALLVRKKKLVDVIGFLDNPTSAIHKLQKKDARIIILLMYESQAREIICSAYKNGISSLHIVWILRGWYGKTWWTVNDTQCTIRDMEKVIKNVLYIDHVDYGTEENVKVLGLRKSEFIEKYENLIRMKNNTIYEVNKYAPYAYDAILVLARALNATEEILKKMNQSLLQFTYARQDITDIIQKKIRETSTIKGITGDIRLDKHGDRITNVWLQQLQDYKVVKVALYNTENNSIAPIPSQKFIWAEGTVPTDKRAVNQILLCISPSMFRWMTGASVCGAMVALYFLFINIKNRSKGFMKMSTPPLNNLIILGTIFAYIYVPVQGMKYCTTEVTPMNSYICKVDIFLISIAFSLAFGSIFMKTWRVYKIFTNVKLSKELKFLTNKHLMAAVMLLLAFDTLYLVVWFNTNPLQDSIKEVLSKSTRHVHEIYVAHACTSKHYYEWFTGLVSYKGLLMFFGMFLTWETRNVSFPGLNESKYIGICVYNLFIVVIVVLPVSLFAFPTKVDVTYGVVAISIIFCTTATLLLMFFPKIHPSAKVAINSDQTKVSVDGSIIDSTSAVSGVLNTGRCLNCSPLHTK